MVAVLDVLSSTPKSYQLSLRSDLISVVPSERVFSVLLFLLEIEPVFPSFQRDVECTACAETQAPVSIRDAHLL